MKFLSLLSSIFYFVYNTECVSLCRNQYCSRFDRAHLPVERKILKTVDIVNDSKLQESIRLKWDMHLVCGA